MTGLVRDGAEQLIRKLRESEYLGPVVMAVAVGLAGGLGAILFRYMIAGLDRLFFSGGRVALSFMGDYYVIALPALGLLVVSFMVRRWAPEAEGHGVPEVMLAVRKDGGRIRPRVAAIKAVASSLCIGSGGSVGREGPIVQIGCSIGSSLGQLLGLSDRRIQLLVACGAAAGVGGTFNAPIAGVIFAMEIILGNFAARSFGVVVISSVTATAVCRSVLGSAPAFQLVEVFKLRSPLELFLYLILGVFIGILALVYVRTLYAMEHAAENMRLDPNIRALIGGLAVGAIGFVGIRFLGGRYLLGVGYDGIERALGLGRESAAGVASAGATTISVLVLLAVLKILATSLTLAAGGSGGVFAPALFIGAMAGGAFGLAVGQLFPSVTAPAGAYALVGMAALFAGAAHAPITSILILFEMTDDYKIILPLMLAVVVSHLMATKLYPDSIYTIKLRRRGGLAPETSLLSTLDVILVQDAMIPDAPTTRPDVAVSELISQFQRGPERVLPVLDETDALVGIVTQADVETAVLAGEVEGCSAQDIMTRNLVTCTPNQTLRQVMRQFTAQDVWAFPVVDREEPQKLLGVLRRQEILWAYGEMATEHRNMLDRTGIRLLETTSEELVQVEFEVTDEDSLLCYRKLQELRVPPECLVVTLRRADRVLIPRGQTVIEPGDVLVALTTPDRESRLRDWFAGHGDRPRRP